MAGGTTRFLGAAAHLDADLAEGLIAEFLVEPYRSIPRSPGVDAHSVLGDAAASHRRRQIRDGVLVLIGVAILLTQPSQFVLWLVVGLVVGASGQLRQGALSRARIAAMVTLVILGLVLATVFSVGSMLVTSLLSSADSSGDLDTLYDVSAFATVLGILAVLAVPLVLLVDEFMVVALVRRFFSRQHFRHEPDLGEAGAVAALRRIGRDRFQRALDRTRSAEQARGPGEAEVVVFRGDSPFVGAGVPYQARTFVFPLEHEDPDDKTPPQVSPQELHREVGQSIEALRRTSSLSPHARLGWTRIEDKVLVSADELVAHWPSAEAQAYLPDGVRKPPATTVPQGVVAQLVAMPREWARHYLCFQVEGWDRDLTVSCYFTLGTDGHLLYLEWVPCVLPSIGRVFRMIDDRRALQRRALHRAMLEIVVFPASLIARARRVARTFEPLTTFGDELVAAKYGAASSLRELAAGPGDDYFHASDANRYVSLFDRAVLESVREFLRARGLKVADIDQAVSQIFQVQATNSTVAVGHRSSAAGAAAPKPAPAPQTKGSP